LIEVEKKGRIKGFERVSRRKRMKILVNRES
jgi:hypothetical protein